MDHANYQRTGKIAHNYFMVEDTQQWAKKHGGWNTEASNWLAKNGARVRDALVNPCIRVYVGKERVPFNVPPAVKGGVTMVPMRAIFEALQANVSYDAAAKQITATKGDTLVQLPLGVKTAVVNGQKVQLDSAAYAKDGNTLVPLRFVSEAMQAEVNWDSVNRAVRIVNPNSLSPDEETDISENTDEAVDEEIWEDDENVIVSQGMVLRDTANPEAVAYAWIRKAILYMKLSKTNDADT